MNLPNPLLMHAHARLSTADRERLSRGLAKTVGVSPERQAYARYVERLYGAPATVTHGHFDDTERAAHPR